MKKLYIRHSGTYEEQSFSLSVSHSNGIEEVVNKVLRKKKHGYIKVK